MVCPFVHQSILLLNPFAGKIVLHTHSPSSTNSQTQTHTQNEAYSINLSRPMLSLALSPTFASSSTRTFACGGMKGDVCLFEKSAWGLGGIGMGLGGSGHKKTVLFEGEGPIWCVRWVGDVLAWGNERVSICYFVSFIHSTSPSLTGYKTLLPFNVHTSLFNPPSSKFPTRRLIQTSHSFCG